jgi:hypothetical protein
MANPLTDFSIGFGSYGMFQVGVPAIVVQASSPPPESRLEACNHNAAST